MKRVIDYTKFIVLILFLYACTGSSEKEVDVSHIPINLTVERLDQELFQLTSKEQVSTFLRNHPLLAEQFFPFPPGTPDSVKVTKLYDLVTNAEVQKLYRETQQTFGDLSNITKEFENAFKHIKYYYPEFVAPKINTIVTGFGNDMFVSDSLIIIGLDFFLGDKATYRPDMEQYRLHRYRPESIVPMTVLLLSGKYNRLDQKDNTMLADMIFYGKAFEFTKYILPHTPDSLIIGYSDQQWTDSDKNRAVVWSHFIDQNLLYETSNFTKIKYVGERPYTAEIGPKAPGSIGRWLGWEIVKKYMQRNEDVTLPELMKNPDAKQIFIKSKYKGTKN